MGTPTVIVVMPAYNAARTLVRTYRDIPPGVVDHVILVDDLSRDDTVAVAPSCWTSRWSSTARTCGYGGNQKTCYDTALAEGADVVVMLHPDYQYDATRIPDAGRPDPGRRGRHGARLAASSATAPGRRHAPLEVRGQPVPDHPPRTAPTACACPSTTPASGPTRRKLLETIDYRANSDDFVFDQELVGQVVRRRLPHRRDPGPDALLRRSVSSVNFRRSVVYGLSTLRTLAHHRRATQAAVGEQRAQRDPADVEGNGGAQRDLAAGC